MDNEVDVKKLLEENERLKSQIEEMNQDKDQEDMVEAKPLDSKIPLEEKEEEVDVKTESLDPEIKLEEKKVDSGKKTGNIKKKILIIILILIILVGIGITVWLTLFNNTFDINTFKKNVVLIMSYDEEGVLKATGSGVYIDEKTIYTNAHVVEDASKLEIVLDNNMKVELKGIQSINKEKDVAILLTDKVKSVKKLKMVYNVKSGVAVYAVGSPLGLKNTVSDGIISGETEGYIQHTAPISPGSSGGALINKKGELIGITVGAFEDGQNLNLAVKVRDFDKEYNKTKNDKPISIETSSMFDIDELMNHPGKDIIKEVCSINMECYASKVTSTFLEKSDEFNHMKEGLDSIIKIDTSMIHEKTYDGDGWLVVYLFKMKNNKDENLMDFKKVVEYMALKTRDTYYYLDFNHYWAKNGKYYYYVEYSEGLNIQKIVDNLNTLTGGKYD